MRWAFALAAIFMVFASAAAVAEPECRKNYEITYCERFPEGFVQLSMGSGFLTWRNLRATKAFILEDGPDEMFEIIKM